MACGSETKRPRFELSDQPIEARWLSTNDVRGQRGIALRVRECAARNGLRDETKVSMNPTSRIPTVDCESKRTAQWRQEPETFAIAHAQINGFGGVGPGALCLRNRDSRSR